MAAARSKRYYVNRYGPTDESVLVADRATLEMAQQVAAIFQGASDAKGESYVYKAETFKATNADGEDA